MRCHQLGGRPRQPAAASGNPGWPGKGVPSALNNLFSLLGLLFLLLLLLSLARPRRLRYKKIEPSARSRARPGYYTHPVVIYLFGFYMWLGPFLFRRPTSINLK